MKTFGQRLKAIRCDIGYTQSQIAKLMNQHVSLMSQWETGRREPLTSNLIRLIKVMRLNNHQIQILLGLKDN